MRKTVNDNHLQLSRLFTVLVISATLLTMHSIAIVPAAGQNGPREEDLIIYFYENQESAYTALTLGDIDFILYGLTSAQADNALTNPNLVTAKSPGYLCYEFDLNNNYTIEAYPGIRSPMNYSEMRKAIAFLSNKDYYVNTLLSGKAHRIDQMITAAFYGWANTSLSYPYYPYEYDPAAAKTMLDSRFPVGTTPNPYYDAGDPLSSAYLREYPPHHPQKGGEDLDPLIFFIRSEDNVRLQSGRATYNALRKMGVPVSATEGGLAVCRTPVLEEFDYHFYTGGGIFGWPPIYLHNYYHSLNAHPYENYVTGNGTHPKLDALLYNAYHAANHSDAVKYTKLAAGYMTEICVNVPLWSRATYWGWSKGLLGIVNMQGGYTPENEYTFMNAYKADGSAIRCGTISLPYSVNMFIGDNPFELNVLNRMLLWSGIDMTPYNAAVDQGGFVRDWETTTWDDNGETKTKVVMTYRSDGYFVKPVSGDQGRNVNATHYFMSMWLYYQQMYSSHGEPHHVNITSSHTFEIYYDTYSYWKTYDCQPRLLPIDSWAAYQDLVAKHTENFTNPTTPGDIPLSGDPFWIASLTFNGTLLIPFTDYNIVKGKLHIYTTLGTGILEVSYWSAASYTAFRGYTVGNLPWQVALEGAGMYYCTGLTPGVGGNATFKRNPYYWMKTSPLGEIDFARKQVNGKPIGPHKVDISDIVLAAGAYGSQGIAVPSANWFPGVDVAAPVGRIDIFDIVTIAGKYGLEWDHPS